MAIYGGMQAGTDGVGAAACKKSGFRWGLRCRAVEGDRAGMGETSALGGPRARIAFKARLLHRGGQAIGSGQSRAAPLAEADGKRVRVASRRALVRPVLGPGECGPVLPSGGGRCAGASSEYPVLGVGRPAGASERLRRGLFLFPGGERVGANPSELAFEGTGLREHRRDVVR